MAAWQFYREEAERWPQLLGKLDTVEALVAVRKLSRHFKVRGEIRVRFTSGRRHSKGSSGWVLYNTDYLTWRLLAHEFAHVIQCQRGLRGARAHDRKLRRIVDRVCRYVERQGWHQGNLAHELALRQDRAIQRSQEAACPPPLDARIAHREQQVRRLESRIKGLGTRLCRARRSLAALRRHQTKAEEVPA